MVTRVMRTTILVVDDDDSARDFASAALQVSGYTVLAANDAHKAVELFRDRGVMIDAVLLSIDMLLMNGEDVLGQIQRIRAGIPVLVCSEAFEMHDIGALAEVEVVGFLRKPYQFDELVARVRALLVGA